MLAEWRWLGQTRLRQVTWTWHRSVRGGLNVIVDCELWIVEANKIICCLPLSPRWSFATKDALSLPACLLASGVPSPAGHTWHLQLPPPHFEPSSSPATLDKLSGLFSSEAVQTQEMAEQPVEQWVTKLPLGIERNGHAGYRQSRDDPSLMTTASLMHRRRAQPLDVRKTHCMH